MVHLKSLFHEKRVSEIEDRCRKAFKEYGVSSILWNVTCQCDLNCWHCYVGDAKNTGIELNADEAQALVSRIGDMGIPLLFMTGGEPLLRKDIFDIIGSCKDRGITSVLSSNGLLINKEIAHKLKRHNVHYVAVSVYGPAVVHDDVVGLDGSFAKLMENAKSCIDAGINVCFKTVVSNYTYENIPYIVEKGLELGVKSFYMCDLIETGHAQGAGSWRISKSQWLKLADYLFEKVVCSSEAEADMGACPSLAPLAIEHFKNKNADVTHALQRLELLSACPIGKGPLGISAKGDVLPCIFMQGFSVGNVLKDDLRMIAFHPTLQSIANKNNLKGRCGVCIYKSHCGGCRAKAYFSDGDINGEDATCLFEQPSK